MTGRASRVEGETLCLVVWGYPHCVTADFRGRIYFAAASAPNGTGHVVLISGEVGIGKSRLVQALKDQVQAEAHTLLECQGSPYHQHTAFWPLTELLPRLFQWQRDESTSGKLCKIARALEQVRLPVE